MDIQPIEERIRELDEEIIKVSGEYAAEAAGKPSFRALDARAAFLRTLFRRRDCILSQYAQAGGNVKNLYTYDAVIGGTEDE